MEFFSTVLRLNLLYGLMVKVVLFPFQIDIPSTLLCLIVVGVGSLSRVLVVLQKTNNVVVRCFLCLVLFKRGGIFDKRSAIFVTLCQWVP